MVKSHHLSDYFFNGENEVDKRNQMRNNSKLANKKQKKQMENTKGVVQDAA